jgi:hypothetical protein
MQIWRKRRNIRIKLRRSGLRIYRNLMSAKLMAWIMALRTMSVYWVFAEPEGFLLLDIDGIDRFNKARKKNNLSKIRVRDANKMAVYRYPKKGWNVIKSHSNENRDKGNSRIRRSN